jgi:hypothetical protein
MTDAAAPSFLTRDEGPAVERMIVADLLKRAWPALLVLVAAGAFWGLDGVASSAYGVGLAVLNLVIAAWMLSTAARISLTLLMIAALGGYLLRLAIITVAVLAVVHAPWVELLPLCLALLVAHLGSLAWEARYVSTSLAYPGLKPKKGAV